jgi:hypothetical protein
MRTNFVLFELVKGMIYLNPQYLFLGVGHDGQPLGSINEGNFSAN